MKKPQLIIEISGGLVSAITTNLKQEEMNLEFIANSLHLFLTTSSNPNNWYKLKEFALNNRAEKTGIIYDESGFSSGAGIINS